MEINTGLSEETRSELAVGLGRLLADTYTLYVKTHGYHWNVTGPMFRTLHLMFEEEYIDLREAVDVIAERIRALGHPAPGSYSEFAELTSVPDEKGVPEAMEMVRNLMEGHESVVRTGRAVVTTAEEAGDVASADLVTQRIDIHEKTAWMLRSMAS
ncbi:MAG: Dps family protein [Acidimicrobiia bacterium]